MLAVTSLHDAGAAHRSILIGDGQAKKMAGDQRSPGILNLQLDQRVVAELTFDDESIRRKLNRSATTPPNRVLE